MKKFLLIFIVLGCLLAPLFAIAQEDFTEFKGEVVDNSNRESLPFVTVGVKDSNISTITNADGEFALKVPLDMANGMLEVSYLGYETLTMPLNSVSEKQKIRLTPAVVNLTEVNLTAFRNAEALVRKVFSDKEGNDLDEDVLMTAFYRETIKRRSRNVSLTEAVINLYKSPNASSKKDVLELRMARKSTDYKRLDTVALKLQGGPFSALYIDVMKYPEYIFTEASITYYNFSFGAPTTIQGKSVYVVNFSQKEEIPPPGYKGKLYIDTETLALTSATYNLVIENAKEASELFVKRKPVDVNVYPTKAAYRVDYKERNGKWYYSYGNVQLSFKVDKRRRLFNSSYTLSSEMAVTDWEKNTTGKVALVKDRMKPTIVMSDDVSGFSDPEFWGPYNVIEPEKSIESAINKIRRKLSKG